MSERVVYLNDDGSTLVQEAEKIGVKKLLHLMQLLKQKNISIDEVIASVEKAYALPEDLKTSLQEFEKRTSERTEHVDFKTRLLSGFARNKRDDCEHYNGKKGVCSLWTWDSPAEIFKEKKCWVYDEKTKLYRPNVKEYCELCASCHEWEKKEEKEGQSSS